MLSRPESTIWVNHGVRRQTKSTSTGMRAYLLLVSQGMRSPPRLVRMPLMRPAFSSKSIPKMRPIATLAQTYGRKVAVLKNWRARSRREFSMVAIITEKTMIKTTLTSQ